MHEQAKIEEAKYFHAKMCNVVNDPAAFRYNLSAFLAAARSALQYAFKEATTNSGGQAWYDAQVVGKPAVKFFQDKRDVNIHQNPVVPSAQIAVSVTDTIRLSDSLCVRIHHKDGTTEERDLGFSASPPEPAEGDISIQCQYLFQDWPGGDDVITLSKSYIMEVEAIVSDGVAKGFLTP